MAGSTSLMIALLSGNNSRTISRKRADRLQCFHHSALWVEHISAIIPDHVTVGHDLTIKEKVAFCNDHSADLAVEIRFRSDKTNGIKILYQMDNDFSRYVAGRFVDLFDFTGSVGMRTSWDDLGNDWLLEQNNCPTVIISPETINNKEHLDRGLICEMIATELVKISREMENYRT